MYRLFIDFFSSQYFIAFDHFCFSTTDDDSELDDGGCDQFRNVEFRFNFHIRSSILMTGTETCL